MANSAFQTIYQELASIRLIDPHTHINPHAPASATLADLLGYHYYTELAHSAGMPKEQIEENDISPRELVGRLVRNLGPITNTAQYSWLIEICQSFFGFADDHLDESNWESVYDAAEAQMKLAEWPQMVLDQSNVEAVFLTNDFDDELTGFDTDTYIPCLRTDDLVFHLAKFQTRQRLEACTGIALDSLISLRESLRQRFVHFVSAGARACAISLPPSFEPAPVSDGRAASALDEILRKGALADESHQVALSRRVFWTLAELCDEFGLPFDLMIGVNRGVYAAGVFQGQDLYDSRVSLIQYAKLFNAFPNVKFPISVLASVTNQELVSYSWIFPNVLTNGHWWYSNTPSFISRDAAARLEAVPRTKQIAYYSDAYKLEFVLPKFDMYRRILANVLADQFVGQSGWSEGRAIELGRQVLRDNVDAVFPRPSTDFSASTAGSSGHTTVDGDDELTAITATETVVEEAGVDANEVFDTRLTDFDTNEELADLPTIIDLDPVPNAEEIKSVGIDDVELLGDNVEARPDADTMETLIDSEPLDVGDITGDDESESQIQHDNTGSDFVPDENSYKLQADPLTGELTFPVANESENNDSDFNSRETVADMDMIEEEDVDDFDTRE